jgi:hypothetical protein
MAMPQESEVPTLVVLESSNSLKVGELENDTAITLMALVSDDPSSWEEAMSVWPRYRTSAVCEFASILPLEEMDRESAMHALFDAEAWIAINFDTKQIFTGGQLQEMGRDAVFAMVVDEDGEQHSPLSIHLPPWWELHEGATASDVNQPRQSPIRKPIVNRDILYGNPFLAEIATLILKIVQRDDWLLSEDGNEEHDCHSSTIAVHRDWLMTPRKDLGGRMPRELLHGAIEWSEKVTWGQHLRIGDGEPMVAVPKVWDGFETAPMGIQELCIYFDLCREVIRAGWFWCESEEGKLAIHANDSALSQLVDFLRDVKENWLNSPFEGGSPPSLIIECDRQRVPRGVGVAIEGIDEVPAEEHIPDCDCPICEMMADGMFGVGFIGIDGHHLELDNEFAFSIHETREAWEEQQLIYAESSEGTNCKQPEREASQEEDPFSSVWSGICNDLPIPGDRKGHLKMAFLVSELVSDLQIMNARQDEIKMLNQAFADYRRSDDERRPQSVLQFKEILQTVGDQYPDLISKSADLQSRLDEAARALLHSDNDLDFP